MGASRFEACKPVARDALKLALLPTVNQMSVIGLISIPGLMTGAVLGGSSVDQAGKLQSTSTAGRAKGGEGWMGDGVADASSRCLVRVGLW